MKLFRVDYIEDDLPITYLTVGEDQDTETTIKERELKIFNDPDSLNYFGVKIVDEVDGYTITIN